MCSSSLSHEITPSILGTSKEYLCPLKSKVYWWWSFEGLGFFLSTCESISMECGMSILCVKVSVVYNVNV